jgi:predicted O-methyltransferase YrrM
LNAARRMRDAAGLARVSRLDFPKANLRDVTAAQLEQIWDDGDIHATWERDHTAITAHMVAKSFYDGINPGDRQAVYKMVRMFKPQTMLEIGTHIGASTMYIALALKANGDNAALTSVDILDVNASDGPWREAGLAQAPRDNMAALDCGDDVTFIAQRSDAFLRDAVSQDQKFDLIFLDGGHEAHTVYCELSMALGILSGGGTIIMHDYYPRAQALFPNGSIIPGPVSAVDRILRENPGLFDVVPLGDLPWDTKDGVTATSLAVLSKVKI